MRAKVARNRRQGTSLRAALLRRYVASRRCATLAANGGRVRPCGDSAASAAYSPTRLRRAGPPVASAPDGVKGSLRRNPHPFLLALRAARAAASGSALDAAARSSRFGLRTEASAALRPLMLRHSRPRRNAMNADLQDVAFAARYALNRHIPDMARGFTISTSYGELAITADEIRRHPELRHAVESIVQFRLFAAERAEANASR